MTFLRLSPSKGVVIINNSDLDITNAVTAKRAPSVTPRVIELAQAGDTQAMGLIYENYAPAIYSLLYRMVWQRETAQELMQDSFIDVLTHLPSYRAEAGLYAWMRKIAVNRCLMYFRKNKAYLVELDQKFEPIVNETCEAQMDTETLLKKLTPKRRMIVWLHEVEGMKHKEIAEVMGKSVSFSKTELSRAMAQLRELSATEPDVKKKLNTLEIENETLETVSNETTNTQNEVALCTPLLNNS